MAEMLLRALCLGTLLAVAGGGCVLPPRAAPHVPVNAWAYPELDWEALGKVVVLPFATEEAYPCDAEVLQKAVTLALRDRSPGRVEALEVAEMPRGDHAAERWTEALPLPTLIRLHREQGADGVLFGTVTYSRPYGLPAVGLKLALVDARDGTLLWIAEDVVDSENEPVRAALDSFCAAEDAATDPEPLHVSLDTFARFVAVSFAATLRVRAQDPAPAPIPERDL